MPGDDLKIDGVETTSETAFEGTLDKLFVAMHERVTHLFGSAEEQHERLEALIEALDPTRRVGLDLGGPDGDVAVEAERTPDGRVVVTSMRQFWPSEFTRRRADDLYRAATVAVIERRPEDAARLKAEADAIAAALPPERPSDRWAPKD